MIPTTENKTIKGLIPPQAIDLEVATLSACLQYSTAVDTLMEVFTDPEVYYLPKNRIVFTAIKELYNKSDAIDLLTISEKLKAMGKLEAVGGDYYLIELIQTVSGDAHQEYHCRILLQKFMARKVIDFCNEGINMAFTPNVDVFDLLDSVTANIDRLSDATTTGYISTPWKDAVNAVPKRVEFLTNNQGIVTGVPTGLKEIDKRFNGWQPQDLIVIGADNGMGKTAFVLNAMLAAAKENIAVGMFSMEMSVTQLAVRSVAVDSTFHMNDLMRNGFNHTEYFVELAEVVDRLNTLPIYIDDMPALTVPAMKRKARALKRKHDIKLLVIDFVQMFSGDKDIRINVSEASRELKNIAKELDIPVIALSQLSRDIKKAKYYIPAKHHLKESSSIEEAADIIGLLYRPGYYNFKREEHPNLYSDLDLDVEHNACLIVAKNRNGGLGNIPLHYVEDKTKFVDPEDSYKYMVKESLDKSPF